MKETWTESEKAELRRCWALGESVTAIGRALGKPRSAISGKARRMKLDRRGAPAALAGARERVAAEKLKDPVAITGCRYIEADDFLARLRRGEQIHCGKPTTAIDESWCKLHKSIVWRKGTSKYAPP